MSDWVNDDGLVVRFGPRPAESGSPAVQNTTGAVQTMIFEFGADIPTPQALRQDGDTRQVPLREGDVILSSIVQIEEAFDASLTVNVGLETKSGSVVSANGIASAASVDTLNEVSVDTGILVGSPVPDLGATGPAYVTVTLSAGSNTVGRGRVLVDYLPRAGSQVSGEIGSGTGASVDPFA